MSGRQAEVVYGINPVLCLLRAGRRKLRRLWLAEGRGKDPKCKEILDLAGELGVRPENLPRDRMTRLAGDRSHQGVVVEAAPVESPDLDQLLSRCPPATLLVALDQVQDPRNMGAVMRSAGAAGAHGVLVPARRQAPLSPAAVKAAEGAVEHVPLVDVGNMSRALDRLKSAGIWVVGLDGAAERLWYDVDLTGPVALVLGSEGSGLRPLVRRGCDHTVALPVAAELDSLNVSATAAVALYEAVRQRRSAGVQW